MRCRTRTTPLSGEASCTHLNEKPQSVLVSVPPAGKMDSGLQRPQWVRQPKEDQGQRLSQGAMPRATPYSAESGKGVARFPGGHLDPSGGTCRPERINASVGWPDLTSQRPDRYLELPTRKRLTSPPE